MRKGQAPPLICPTGRRAALRTREGTQAGGTGLWAIASAEFEDLVVRHRSAVPTHALAFERIVLTREGESYKASIAGEEVSARAAREASEEPDSAPARDEG